MKLANEMLATFKAGETRKPSDPTHPSSCDKPLDPRNDVVSVVLFTRKRVSEGEVIRFFLHDPYVAHLNGIKRIREYFLAPSADATLLSSYVATSKPNPLLAQIPTALKEFKWEKVVSPFKALGEEPPKDLVAVKMSDLVLPFTRGTLVIKDEARLPQQVKPKALAEKGKDLKEQNDRWRVRSSPCAATVNTEVGSLFQGDPDDDEEPTAGASTKEQWDFLMRAIKTAGDAALTSPECKVPDPITSEAISQLDTAREVYDGYVRLVTQPEPAKATATTTYENVPLERYSITLLGGVVTNPNHTDRVELSGTNLVKKSMNEVLSALAVNFHFKRFDPKSEKLTWGERWRGFAGLAYTPEVGIVGGVGYGVLRNLSVNAGAAAMRIDALNDGDTLGAAPANPDDPFNQEIEMVGFFALGFSF